MTELAEPNEDILYRRVSQIIESARQHVARTVNSAMVSAYWLIGQQLVENEQEGEERAQYGQRVVEQLSKRLSQAFGSGFSVANLRRMRQFYLAFPQGSAIAATDEAIRAALPRELVQRPHSVFPPSLSWTHYVMLITIENQDARFFYEIEAARENWSTRVLERQIASLLYERLAKSRNKENVLALARKGQEISTPHDVLKDPMVLEFLDMDERPNWHERDLEQAIIDQLEAFLLELGKGFCFVARQKRITLDGDHFYVDLVFYNRLLRCFVLVDLKLGKLTHEDLGQMQMYVHYFDRHQRESWEAPTVGIILCSAKNDAMVRITLPEDNQQIHASQYHLYLPTEDELCKELVSRRERIEDVRRVANAESQNDARTGDGA